MIQNEAQLDVTRRQLRLVEEALESLRQNVRNPRNLAIYSEPYVDQIDVLKAEIAEYLQSRQLLPPKAALPQNAPGQQPTSAT